MYKERRPKDIIIRGSYRDGEGRGKRNNRVDVENEDTMLDRKHQLPTGKFHEMWGSYGCVNYRYITRFFHANIGRPFSEVTSKLMAKTDSRTWEGNKFREAIIAELAHPNPCKVGKDGSLYTVDGNHIVSKYSGYRAEYYVDENLILREHKKEKRRKRAVSVTANGVTLDWAEYIKQNPQVHSIKIARDDFLIKINGSWFVIGTSDLSFLDGNPNKEPLLISLSAGVQHDVVLYDKSFQPRFKEKFHTHVWERMLRQTYCGELRVGLTKKSAPADLMHKYGLRNADTYVAPTTPGHWKDQSVDPAKNSKSLDRLLSLFE